MCAVSAFNDNFLVTNKDSNDIIHINPSGERGIEYGRDRYSQHERTNYRS